MNAVIDRRLTECNFDMRCVLLVMIAAVMPSSVINGDGPGKL